MKMKDKHLLIKSEQIEKTVRRKWTPKQKTGLSFLPNRKLKVILNENNNKR